MKKNLILIAGNCVLETKATATKTAEILKNMGEKFGFDCIFKASFKKDNRSSADYFVGLPIEEAMDIFDTIRQSYQLPVLTDFSNINELKNEKLINVVDILQLPAFLCMQTELTIAMAEIGKPINIKKGQFLAPEDVGYIIDKIRSVGNVNNNDIMITERGHCFGYHDLVFDPRAIPILKQFGYPVIFDAGHTVRKYGVPSCNLQGGSKEFIRILAKAAIAAGADGIFVEIHPEPAKAKCDSATQLSFEEFKSLIKEVIPIWEASRLLR